MQGNERYAANTPRERDFSAGRAARASAQFPIAAILSCSDSRVVPDLVFDQSPGDLFVVRLAGNFLDDDGLASLEYAVKFLGAPVLMVVGHTQLRRGLSRRQGGEGARRAPWSFAGADQVD
ncbi:MAG: carbonic anhydrase [Methyloceanibacter sp.]